MAGNEWQQPTTERAGGYIEETWKWEMKAPLNWPADGKMCSDILKALGKEEEEIRILS